MPSSTPTPKLRSFKEITSTLPEGKELEAAWNDINQGSDTTAALIVNAWLDRHLEKALRLNFVQDLSKTELDDLFGYPAPLDSLSSKTRVAYAIGMFGKVTRDNLSAVTKIRNLFAHTPTPISFDTPEVANACKRLKIIEAYKIAPHLGLHHIPDAGETARSQYIESSIAMILALMVYQQEYINTQELTDALLQNRSPEQKLADAMSIHTSKPFLP